jgi:excisionase family DNA binding protein
MKNTLKLPEVAEQIGVHASTLQRWCAQGKGPLHIKTPGGMHLFRADDVATWLKALKPEYADPQQEGA